MSRLRWIRNLALISAVCLLGCRSEEHGPWGLHTAPIGGSVDLILPAGMSIDVRLGTQLTWEGTRVGDQWTGEVARPVILNGRTLAHAGSVAGGTVTKAGPAFSGDLELLRLALTSFRVGNLNYRVHNTTESIVGGGSATSVVSQNEDRQVVLIQGTPLRFTTRRAVALRP